MIAVLPVALLLTADPARAAWIMGADAPGRPNVHSVEVRERTVEIRSSGVALRYLGLLQSPPAPQTSVREFVFELPRVPRAASTHERIPVDIGGVFLNGMPIYNPCETLSYNGANLWHYDAAAMNDDGTLTAGGHPHESLTHRPSPGLLDDLAKGSAAPVIGFALDGFPIYGKPMRSSYRLRQIKQRHTWPDGTELTPEQYGPDVTPADPLGTFAEDYEYVEGSGDLDQFNGKAGAAGYGYYLATDAAGRLAYPYIVGPRYYGALPSRTEEEFFPVGTRRNVRLSKSVRKIEVGDPVTFRLEVPGLRHFEYVHERPIHMLIASDDLQDFFHIHPELKRGDVFEVAHVFPRGGAYRIWADFSLPGEAPRVEQWDIVVAGPRGVAPPAAVSSMTAELVAGGPLRTGVDVPITLKLSGADETLEPYLGAWAHVVIVNQGLTSFAHAHPIDGPPSAVHTHVLGPTPQQVRIVTSFPTPGTYKLWAQFQKAGQVITLPFVLHVEQGVLAAATGAIPADAVRVRIGQHGYDPARVEIPANRPVTLAFTRDNSPNCGADVFVPALGVRRNVPIGETVLIELPAQPAGEMSFTCGMGMFRGMIVAK